LQTLGGGRFRIPVLFHCSGTGARRSTNQRASTGKPSSGTEARASQAAAAAGSRCHHLRRGPGRNSRRHRDYDKRRYYSRAEERELQDSRRWRAPGHHELCPHGRPHHHGNAARIRSYLLRGIFRTGQILGRCALSEPESEGLDRPRDLRHQTHVASWTPSTV
jgi:hypothetical protein